LKESCRACDLGDGSVHLWDEPDGGGLTGAGAQYSEQSPHLGHGFAGGPPEIAGLRADIVASLVNRYGAARAGIRTELYASVRFLLSWNHDHDQGDVGPAADDPWARS
jgi:hypothetical protein